MDSSTTIHPAYVAGFLDADGGFHFRVRQGNRLGQFYLYIRLTAALYPSVLKKIQKHYGGRFLCQQHRPPERPVYQLSWEGALSIQKLLEQIDPYIIAKRKQADLAKQIINHIKSENRIGRGKLSTETINKRKAFATLMKQYNQQAEESDYSNPAQVINPRN